MMSAADLDLTVEAVGLLPHPEAPLRLDLAVRDGAVAAGLAGCGMNRLIQPLDVAGLRLVKDRVQGRVAWDLPSDGWVPAWGSRIALVLELDLPVAGGAINLTGTRDGQAVNAMATVVSAVADVGGPAHAVLHLLNAEPRPAGDPAAGWKARPVKLDIWADADHAIFGALAEPPGSPTDVSCDLSVQAATGALSDHHVQAKIRVQLTEQKGAQHHLTWTIAAIRIGARIGGTLTTTWTTPEGPASQTGAITGNLVPPLSATWADGTIWLACHGVLGPQGWLNLRLSRRGDALTAAIATTPNSRNSIHSVRRCDLRQDPASGRITGTVAVTVHPDPWVPADRSQVEVVIEVDATCHQAPIANGFVLGRYLGTANGAAISGMVDGRLADFAQPLPAEHSISMSLESAIPADKDWYGRVFISGTVRDGRLVDGKLWNNHYKELTGTATGAVSTTADGLVLALTFTVPTGLKVRAGTYQVAATLPRIDSLAAGPFTCTSDAGVERAGTCWVAVGPVRAKR